MNFGFDTDNHKANISDQEARLRVSDKVRRRAAGRGTAVHLHLPEGTEGPEPADPRLRPPRPLFHPRPRHRAHRDARHQVLGGRHVAVRPEDGGSRHPEASQPRSRPEGRAGEFDRDVCGFASK